MNLKQIPEPICIYDKSVPGHIGCNLPIADTPKVDIKAAVGHIRENLNLPEVYELEAIRHFVNLSQNNYGIENGFYPLGSCTMKYNPRVNEIVAGNPGFTQTHPLQPKETAKGNLQVIAQVESILNELTGFDHVILQPLAGAHGELTCLMLIKAFHESKGQSQRKFILVPDSAHGTNPATAAMCGYKVKVIPTNSEGGTDIDKLKDLLSDEVAALMLTNPSTLGLFEKNIEEICKLAHEAGAQVFCDGANMNAMVGTTRPGDHGFDCMHLNLHKTFSTPQSIYDA